jgi:hypothetical protein
MEMGKKNGETEYVKRLVSDFEGIIQKYKILNRFSSPSLGFTSSTSIEDLEKLSKIRKELKELGKLHLIGEEDPKNEIKKERLKVFEDDYTQIEFDGKEYNFNGIMAKTIKIIIERSREGKLTTKDDLNKELHRRYDGVGRMFKFLNTENNKYERHSFFIDVIKKHSDAKNLRGKFIIDIYK